MLIQEVCRESRLTKKAIEYYTEQELIHPAAMENGYRVFSEFDVDRLKRIGVLRGLGLSVPDIKVLLDSRDAAEWSRVARVKDFELSELREKENLLEELARNKDWSRARAQLDALESKQSILRRLVEKFPGYYGKLLSLHFAPFLDEQIVTREQQQAFETVLSFLDDVDITIPEDLREYLDEAARKYKEAAMPDVSESLAAAIHNTEQYMAQNKEVLEQYREILTSDRYKQSPAYRLKELLKKLNRENGYDDRFIPAMKKLSPAYRKYHDELLKANEIFTEKFGEVR